MSFNKDEDFDNIFNYRELLEILSQERLLDLKDLQLKEKTISQQAEIIKILREACEEISKETRTIGYYVDPTYEAGIAIKAIAQIEKLKVSHEN